MFGIVNTARKAVYEAANIIQQFSRKTDLKIKNKEGVNKFVSLVVQKTEHKIIEVIRKTYPEHNIISEQNGHTNNFTSDYTWIIDPLNGSTNFIHNHPSYCTSIAVRYKDKITHGVIFDFNKSDFYYAINGKGAFLNDKRIRVSNVKQMNMALIGVGFPSDNLKTIEAYFRIFREISLQTSGQRRSGSVALDLAYVAAGILDGFWEFSLNNWDFAAGVLLIKEAGGFVTDFKGESGLLNSGNIVAGNYLVCEQLLSIIANNIDLV